MPQDEALLVRVGPLERQTPWHPSHAVGRVGVGAGHVPEVPSLGRGGAELLPWWPAAGSGRSQTPSCCPGPPPSGPRGRGSSPDATP